MKPSRIVQCGILGWLAGCNSPASTADEFGAQASLTNGFCAGISWVNLLPGETMHEQSGPDFAVYKGEGPNGTQWGVYWGSWASSSPQSDHVLIHKSNVEVVRAVKENGQFDGYIVEESGEQNHFFGNVFAGTASDAKFFDRVQLGSVAQAMCEKSEPYE